MRLARPSPRRALAPGVAAALAVAFAAACDPHAPSARPQGERRRAEASEGVSTGVSATSARFVANVGGLAGPESVRYDPELDVYYISCMTGYGSHEDSNGVIVRVSAGDPGVQRALVRGGTNGATLHAPKGMAVHGDTLWVADIRVLRGFHRLNGATLATIDFAPHGATLLNDVALAPDGTLRVTDTGIIMSPYGVMIEGRGRIYAVGAGGRVSVVPGETPLAQPNGITWDAGRARWLVGSFDPFVGRVTASTPDGKADTLRSGTARIDGVEVLPNGNILYTSWGDSSLRMLSGGRDAPLIRQLPEAADLGVDTRRGNVAIPLSVLGVVQIWSLGEAWSRPAPKPAS